MAGKERKAGCLNLSNKNTLNAQAWWLLNPALFYVVFSANKIALSGRGSSVGSAGGNHPFRSNFRGEKIPTPFLPEGAGNIKCSGDFSLFLSFHGRKRKKGSSIQLESQSQKAA